MIKKFFCDVETTGTSIAKHEIIQIGGIIEIDGKIEKEFSLKTAPKNFDSIDPKALEVNGITKNELKDYPNSRQTYQELIKILENYVDKFNRKDKFFFLYFAGSDFDPKFLRKFFFDNKDKYFGSWFFMPSIDIAGLAEEHLLMIRPLMENFKLNTVARTLKIGVSQKDLHDAMYDTKLAYKIYQVIKKEKIDA